MDTISIAIAQYESNLDRSLSQHKFFRDIEARINIRKTYVAIGAVLLFLFLVYFNFAGQLLTGLMGWAYPAYESFKAVEVPGAHVKRQWFTYWSIFGLVQTLEYFSRSIVYWAPAYYVFKTLFLLWLALPQFKGAEMIYLHAVLPLSARASPPPAQTPNVLKKDK
ncbi:TB2/DP1, HVA22 family-domain-containing protein [Dichotomocladium elegans]|nr:TB2/DP1, HVA22 family-domain-containing protein [Dichotomocladium elegans]